MMLSFYLYTRAIIATYTSVCLLIIFFFFFFGLFLGIVRAPSSADQYASGMPVFLILFMLPFCLVRLSNWLFTFVVVFFFSFAALNKQQGIRTQEILLFAIIGIAGFLFLIWLISICEVARRPAKPQESKYATVKTGQSTPRATTTTDNNTVDVEAGQSSDLQHLVVIAEPPVAQFSVAPHLVVDNEEVSEVATTSPVVQWGATSEVAPSEGLDVDGDASLAPSSAAALKSSLMTSGGVIALQSPAIIHSAAALPSNDKKITSHNHHPNNDYIIQAGGRVLLGIEETKRELDELRQHKEHLLHLQQSLEKSAENGPQHLFD